MAMARPSVGAKPPEVTLPTTLPASAISAPSRAIALPSGRRATRLRGAPSAICFWMTGAPGEAALLAALLADAPQQARLDGRGRGVDVVAVETEAGFEPQRVARAQTDRLDLRLGQKLAGDGIRGVGRRRDLEAVAAGIARARDVAARAVDHDEGPGHEFQAGDLRRQPRQRLRRQRTLQGQKPAREHRLDLAGRGEVLLQMCEVGVLAGGIDHQQEMIARAGHHEIVEDAAALVGELGVALLAGFEAGDVGRHQPLQRLGRALPRPRGEPHLAHVRDVEQAGCRPGLGMFGQDAGRILHRHLIAGEGHEARAELAMQVVKRCALERAGRGFGQKDLQSRVSRRKDCAARPPLSGDLKDSPDAAGLLRRWAHAGWGARHFPETHPPAVRLPESFRGRLLLRRRLLLARSEGGLSHRARLGAATIGAGPRPVHGETSRKWAVFAGSCN